jgi:hypothetical protein
MSAGHAWTALSLTGSRNDPDLTPAWFAMNSIHSVTHRVQAAPGQEGREPVQHDLLATDRALGPASLAQHRQDAADGDPGICLSHENHLCIR